jgi:hypothetical protein
MTSPRNLSRYLKKIEHQHHLSLLLYSRLSGGLVYSIENHLDCFQRFQNLTPFDPCLFEFLFELHLEPFFLSFFQIIPLVL